MVSIPFPVLLVIFELTPIVYEPRVSTIFTISLGIGVLFLSRKSSVLLSPVLLSVARARAPLAASKRHLPSPCGRLYDVLRHAEACATLCDAWPGPALLRVPPRLALVRALSGSGRARPRPRRSPLRNLATCGGMRDRPQRFTPPSTRDLTQVVLGLFLSV